MHISKSIQDNHRVTIDDGNEVSFGTIVFDLDYSDLDRSNRGQAYFRGS